MSDEEEVPELPTLAELERCQRCGRPFRTSSDEHNRPVATVKGVCGHENTVRVPTIQSGTVHVVQPDIDAIRAQCVEEVFRIIVANDLPDYPSQAVAGGLLEAFCEMVRDGTDRMETDAAMMMQRLRARMQGDPKLKGSAQQLANYGIKAAPTILALARYAIGA